MKLERFLVITCIDPVVDNRIMKHAVNLIDTEKDKIIKTVYVSVEDMQEPSLDNIKKLVDVFTKAKEKYLKGE